ncbi:hypothetical protein FHR70_000944 [Microvirga lupini]|uniref:Uncharacterized protein n=1 Tax=Microvirga lupini TaxID=420324 RepID=A0A7W4VIN4_9HYPH|nr:hypothetical protein [Microvirga lupini]MBB3017904.1 hypothetical protein [Microvirga lupini]
MADERKDWAPEIALIVEASVRMAERFNCHFVPDLRKIESFPTDDRVLSNFVPLEFLSSQKETRIEDK